MPGFGWWQFHDWYGLWDVAGPVAAQVGLALVVAALRVRR
jgi:hypothetical protein